MREAVPPTRQDPPRVDPSTGRREAVPPAHPAPGSPAPAEKPEPSFTYEPGMR